MNTDKIRMAIKKTTELILEFATMVALSYQPDSKVIKTRIPMVNPPDIPISKGLILVLCLSRFDFQKARNTSFSSLNMRQK